MSESYPNVTFLESGSEDELDEFNYVDVLEQNVMEKSRPEHVPLVFCTGVAPGTIEDAELGFLADTEARSWIRNLNNKEVVVDSVRILARIQGPTEDDPFGFLGIKWCSHSTPGAAGCFIKRRDYVVVESSGTALDSHGERFCYVMNPSIELDEVPNYVKFGLVRMKFSACHIMRPHVTAGAIEIFCRGYMDTGGNLAERMCTCMFCDSLMTVPQVVEEAYTKKLMWLLHAQRRVEKTRPLAHFRHLSVLPRQASLGFRQAAGR